MTWRLLTIRISHFNEKARWGLDRCGLEYEEEPYAPVLHMAGTAPLLLRRGAGRADKVSTRFSTPVLVTEDRVIPDSSEILAFAEQQSGVVLYPNDEARELDAHFSGRFAADTRRLIYWYLLPDDELFDEISSRNLGATQAKVSRGLRPIVSAMLRRVLKIEEGRAMRSRDDIRREFESVSARLADGRGYLVGDRFSAADLSFAALSSLVLAIGEDDGYGAWLPGRERLPPEFGALVDELRETAAGQFTLRMYAQERAHRIRPCRV